MKGFFLVYLLLSLLLPSIWTGSGRLLATGEEGPIFYNPSRALHLHGYSWQDIGTGASYPTLTPRLPLFVFTNRLSTLGLSSLSIQYLVFSFLLFTSFVAAYELAYSLTHQAKISFLAGLIYVFNPFTSVHIWNRFLFTLMFSLPLIPATLAVFVAGLARHRLIYILLFPLPSLLFAPAFGSPAVALTLWVPIFLYSLLSFSKQRTFFPLLFLGLCLLIWSLANFWWVSRLRHSSTSFSLASPDYNLRALQSLSRYSPLSHISRLISTDYPYSPSLTWLLPILALFSVIKFHRLPAVQFAIPLFLVGLFIAKGTSPPLGNLFAWLFTHLSPLQLWRNAFEKAGLLLVISYSLLIPFTIIHLPRFFSAVFIFVLVGVANSPVWTGQIFQTTQTSIPDYWGKASVWLDSLPPDTRLLSLPAPFGDGATYSWQPPYHGLNPLPYLLSRPLVSHTLSLPEVDLTYRTYLKYLTRLPLWQFARLYSARYLLIDSDISWQKLGLFSPSQVQALLLVYTPPSPNLPSPLADCPPCDLSNSKYVRFTLTSPQPVALETQIIDATGRRLRFDGLQDPQYSFPAGASQVILPLHQPTETDPDFDFSRISKISFFPPVQTSPLWPDAGSPLPQKHLSSKISFPPLSFYEFSPQVVSPRIFAAGQIMVVPDVYSLFSFISAHPESIPPTFVVDPQNQFQLNITSPPAVSFIRLNPTHYRVEVAEATEPFLLVFHESFHPSWRVTVSGQTFPHLLVDGYANGWLVNRTGSFTLEVKFL